MPDKSLHSFSREPEVGQQTPCASDQCAPCGGGDGGGVYPHTANAE